MCTYKMPHLKLLTPFHVTHQNNTAWMVSWCTKPQRNKKQHKPNLTLTYNTGSETQSCLPSAPKQHFEKQAIENFEVAVMLEAHARTPPRLTR